jgi:hypothetical protein
LHALAGSGYRRSRRILLPAFHFEDRDARFASISKLG